MSWPNNIVWDDTAFRTQFPYFSNTTTYTPTALQQYFTNATSYISTQNYGYMQGADRQQALYLMVAHFVALNTLLTENAGAAFIMVKGAKIDKISVDGVPPPAKTQFQWWLNLTPWGAQLLALLQIQSAGGWNIGGLPERLAFRRVGGGFGGPMGFRGACSL